MPLAPPVAALLLAALAQSATAPAQPAPVRVPIDLGPDAPGGGEPPREIDILAPQPPPEAASVAVLKECEDQREAGIVAGEIVVCRELEVPTDQLYSGSREAWLRDYAARTQGAGTIPAPDVAGAGIFRGPATVSNLCFIPPCRKETALIVDVEAIPPPPEDSDAERVAQGLAPLGDDETPLSEEERRRIEAQLGLPARPAAPEG